MQKFVEITTGIGTSFTARVFYGPFELEQDTEPFVENVREGIAALGPDTSAISVTVVDELPIGWNAQSPSKFMGFQRL